MGRRGSRAPGAGVFLTRSCPREQWRGHEVPPCQGPGVQRARPRLGGGRARLQSQHACPLGARALSFLPATRRHSPLVPGAMCRHRPRARRQKSQQGTFPSAAGGSVGKMTGRRGVGGRGRPAGRTDAGPPCTVTRETHWALPCVGSGAGSRSSPISVVIHLLSPGRPLSPSKLPSWARPLPCRVTASSPSLSRLSPALSRVP